MAANNLRILYADKLIGVSGGTSPTNLLNDYKSQTSYSDTFTLTTTSITGQVAIVAVLAETTTTVTMEVVTSITSGEYIESTTSAVSEISEIGYGGGKYITVYLNLYSEPITTFTVNFDSSVKVSRFIVGNYWSPTYNTSFGMQAGFEDTSTSERLQSGDLYSTPGPRHKVLSFELPNLTDSDKFRLFDIVKLIGKSKPIFISLFPSDSDKEREQIYSIYGKFTNLPSLTYSMFTKYVSSLQIEEF
jgi:hypothetical protein